MTPEIKKLILDLYEIQAIKFGTFTLNSGKSSPIYIDLRLTISYPTLLKQLSAALWTRISRLSFDVLCPVPYAAVPLTTAISLEHNIAMIMCRKEAKNYGLKKRIEGQHSKGQRCLIIEDVTVSGASILETVAPLTAEGLEVEDVVVVVNREQGAQDHLRKKGIQLHSLVSVFDLLKVLFYEKKITEETFRSVNELLA